MCINTGFSVREFAPLSIFSVASVTSLPLVPPNKLIHTIHQYKARRIAIKKLVSDQKSVNNLLRIPYSTRKRKIPVQLRGECVVSPIIIRQLRASVVALPPNE